MVEMGKKKKFVIEGVNEATGGRFDDGTKEFTFGTDFGFQKGLAKLGEGKIRITIERID